jgi:hypothetical protein
MSKPAPSKRFRKLAKALKPYGYYLAPLPSGHNGIFDGSGRRIYTMSNSPKVVQFAMANTLKDLKKMGYVPKEVKL